MFARVLLTTADWYMTITWFGLGKLQVSNFRTGQTAIADPALKSYFMATIEAIGRSGYPVDANNPVIQTALLFFAKAILNPRDLMVRAAFSQAPKELARALIIGHYEESLRL